MHWHREASTFTSTTLNGQSRVSIRRQSASSRYDSSGQRWGVGRGNHDTRLPLGDEGLGVIVERGGGAKGGAREGCYLWVWGWVGLGGEPEGWRQGSRQVGVRKSLSGEWG